MNVLRRRWRDWILLFVGAADRGRSSTGGALRRNTGLRDAGARAPASSSATRGASAGDRWWGNAERATTSTTAASRVWYANFARDIGQLLFDSLNAFAYHKLAAIVVVIIVAVSLIDLLSQAMRSRLL